MKAIQKIRIKDGFSQRKLAKKASIAYKTLQLIESENHDVKLSTLEKVTDALGFPSSCIEYHLKSYIEAGSNSIYNCSLRILENSEASWKLWLFEFVDTFRHEKAKTMIADPPSKEISRKIKALLTSTVEALCQELNIDAPWWVAGIGKLDKPWFVSGFESLKSSAIIESPIAFRKRNIFVLKNFLERV